MPSSKSGHKKHGGDGKSGHKKHGGDGKSRNDKKQPEDDPAQVFLTIFIFRGNPDVHYKRHILLYATSSDDPNFHETIHVQRNDEDSPWAADRDQSERNWEMSATYISHVNAGFVLANRGEEGAVMDVLASTPVEGGEGDWNCQNYLLEGLKLLVSHGYQTAEWYDHVEDEVTTALLDGAVG